MNVWPSSRTPICVGDINIATTTAPTNLRRLFSPLLCVPGMADTPTHCTRLTSVQGCGGGGGVSV